MLKDGGWMYRLTISHWRVRSIQIDAAAAGDLLTLYWAINNDHHSPDYAWRIRGRFDSAFQSIGKTLGKNYDDTVMLVLQICRPTNWKLLPGVGWCSKKEIENEGPFILERSPIFCCSVDLRVSFCLSIALNQDLKKDGFVVFCIPQMNFSN